MKESTLNIVCPNVGIGAVSHHKLYAFFNPSEAALCTFREMFVCKKDNIATKKMFDVLMSIIKRLL